MREGNPADDVNAPLPERVLKWRVPLDGKSHEIGPGSVVLVATQDVESVIYVWTLEHPADTALKRKARVFGTGESLPRHPKWAHIGSCLAGSFVWHVFTEVPAAPPLTVSAGTLTTNRANPVHVANARLEEAQRACCRDGCTESAAACIALHADDCGCQVCAALNSEPTP